MIIVVKEIISVKDVFFDTQYGCARGIWCDGTPETGKEYLVEFDIKEILEWGNCIIEADICEYRIGIENDKVFLIGKIELVEDNGSVIIRIGESTVMMLTCGVPRTYDGYVKVMTKSLGIYDTYAI